MRADQHETQHGDDVSSRPQAPSVATPTSFKPKKKQVVIAGVLTVGVLILVFGVMLPSIVSYDDIWLAIKGMEPWNLR